MIANIFLLLAEVSLVILIFFLLARLVKYSSQLLNKNSKIQLPEDKLRNLERNLKISLWLTCVVLCVLIVGANVFLIYRSENPQQFTLELFSRISPDFWLTLGIGIVQSLGSIIAAVIVLKLIESGLNIANTFTKGIEKNTADDPSIEVFYKTLNQRIKIGVWLWVLISCSQFLKLPAEISQHLYAAQRIYLIVAIGLVILKGIAAIVDIVDVFSLRQSQTNNLLKFYNHLRHLLPFLKRCLEFIVYLCMATLVTQQLESIAKLSIFGLRMIQIVALVLLSRLAFETFSIVIEETLLSNQDLTETQKSKRLTIIPLFRSLLKYLIYFGVGISILYIMEIDPTPILAGAGIIGLAVGLGAQTLINDVVSGFFILFENQYLVGDYIEITKAEDFSLEGIVESIELRTTRIRHPNGQLHIIRNGDVGLVTNYSKQYIFAVVEVEISYEADLTHVYKVVEEVGNNLQVQDKDVLEPTQVEGVEDLGDSHLLLRTLTKVRPGKHLRIQRTLRQMLIFSLRQEEIWQK